MKGRNPTGWAVLIPAKELTDAKRRLDLNPAFRQQLAAAFLADAVIAALRAERVASVTVLTSDAALGSMVTFLGAEWRMDRSAGGLNAAVEAGLPVPDNNREGRAVLVGDLPCLRPYELDSALSQAKVSPTGRLCVTDRGGQGTTLLAALGSTAIDPMFGKFSSRRHQSAGFLPAQGDLPGLRGDIDLPEDLEQLASGEATGSCTEAALNRWIALRPSTGLASTT
ncbi:MAG: 2-phospho-L-lactate guanylyltransferase [Nocardioides sp.]|uniref:2-phospho-L-lactate guanylyltransferase n=1 Tax=Nocardioides sp. TaxID=35761 RepID=UPI003264C3B2